MRSNTVNSLLVVRLQHAKATEKGGGRGEEGSACEVVATEVTLKQTLKGQ